MNQDEELLRRHKDEHSWLIPGAIICAGIVLAFTTYSFRYREVTIESKGDVSLIRPVQSTDHIIGNPAAPVTIVEYADIDSSYAKSFQNTMEQVMLEYAPTGKVAWVYRHLPLIDQHPYSKQHAEAAECVARIGGPDYFWKFIDALNTYAPGGTLFNPKNYNVVVSGFGIEKEAFSTCLQDKTIERRVASDFDNALSIGADGSPFLVVIITGYDPVTIQGAVPYDSLKKIIDTSIEKAAAKF